MSKWPPLSSDCHGNMKRKHLSLSIREEFWLLMKLDRGMPVKRLSEEFAVRFSAVLCSEWHKLWASVHFLDEDNHPRF